MRSLFLLAALCCLVLSTWASPVREDREVAKASGRQAPAAAPAASDDDDDDEDDDDDVDLDDTLADDDDDDDEEESDDEEGEDDDDDDYLERFLDDILGGEDDDDDDDEPSAAQPVVAPVDTVAAAPAAAAPAAAAAEDAAAAASEESADVAEAAAEAEGDEPETAQKEPASAEVENAAAASAEAAAPAASDDDEDDEDDITDALDPEDDDDDEEDDDEEEDDDDDDDDITDALGRNNSQHSPRTRIKPALIIFNKPWKQKLLKKKKKYNMHRYRKRLKKKTPHVYVLNETDDKLYAIRKKKKRKTLARTNLRTQKGTTIPLTHATNTTQNQTVTDTTLETKPRTRTTSVFKRIMNMVHKAQDKIVVSTKSYIEPKTKTTVNTEEYDDIEDVTETKKKTNAKKEKKQKKRKQKKASKNNKDKNKQNSNKNKKNKNNDKKKPKTQNKNKKPTQKKVTKKSKEFKLKLKKARAKTRKKTNQEAETESDEDNLTDSTEEYDLSEDTENTSTEAIEVFSKYVEETSTADDDENGAEVDEETTTDVETTTDDIAEFLVENDLFSTETSRTENQIGNQIESDSDLTRALKEETTKTPVPAIYILKYNSFVDNILEKMNEVLRRSYDPVSVKLQPIDANKKSTKPKKNKTKSHKRKSSHKKKHSARGPTVEKIQDRPEELEPKDIEEKKALEEVEQLARTLRLARATKEKPTKAKPSKTKTKPSIKAPSKAKPTPKPPAKNKNEKSKPRAKGTLYGLASLRRIGDVSANIQTTQTTLKSNFAIGPLTLRVEKEIGRGAKKEIKSATATTAEMTGKIVLKVNSQGLATLQSIKVLQPKQVRVDSNHDRTRELVWRRSAKIAHVVHEQLLSASKPMFSDVEKQ